VRRFATRLLMGFSIIFVTISFLTRAGVHVYFAALIACLAYSAVLAVDRRWRKKDSFKSTEQYPSVPIQLFPGHAFVASVLALALASGILLVSEALVWPLAAAWIALAVLAVIEAQWLVRNARSIGLELEAPDTAVRGDTLACAIRARNPLERRVDLRVRPLLPAQGKPNDREMVFAVDAGTGVEAPFKIGVPVRGLHQFEGIYARMLSPWRLVQCQWFVSAPRACRVFPDIRTVKEYIVSHRMRTALAPHLRTAPLRGIGSEFESLRDYVQGDDIRRIDWRATARANKLIAREYEIEQERNIVVIIDCGRLMAGSTSAKGIGMHEWLHGIVSPPPQSDGPPLEATKLDHAVDAALMLAGVSLENGDRFGLMLFADDLIAYLPPHGGMGHLQTVTNTLYDVQPTLSESHFRKAFLHLQTRLTKRSLVVVISDVIDVQASSSLVTGVLSLAKRHLVVMAALRTPEIERVLDDTLPADAPRPVREEVPFRKAVAYRLLRERAEVMGRLHKGGVEVIDLRPEELTVPLINKYLDLRQQNRV